MVFNFCPECGTKTLKKEIGDDGLIPYCEECKKPYFDYIGQCIIVVVINEQHEIALLKQEHISSLNWVLVAGYMKKGETAEESAIREVLEETGQQTNKLQYIDSYYYDKKELLMLGYVSFVEKRAFNNSFEVDDVKWFSYEEALSLLRPGSIAEKHTIKAYKLISDQR